MRRESGYHGEFMPIYQVLVLGLLQGLTEFLPVSSSAHLALAPWLFGWKDQGLSFDIALHVGTLAAVLIYFGRDWIQVIGQAFGLKIGNDPFLAENPKLLWFLAAASLPVGIAGLLFKSKAEHALRSPYVIGVMLILVGIVLYMADRMSLQRKHIGTINSFDAMVIGFAQALAIVPGTSRSGITIAAGLFSDLDRASAARFSFLLSTPAIIAATFKDFYDLFKNGGIPDDMVVPFAVGIATSAISGIIVIAFFLQYLRRSSLKLFVYYRVALGIVVLALAITSGYKG